MQSRKHPSPWILALWPGLAPLWLRGDAVGLMTAAVFACLLNFALLTSFVWPEVIPSNLRLGTWGMVALFWMVSALIAWRRMPTYHREAALGGSDRAVDEILKNAQTEYLQGNWYNAESLLKEILLRDPRDVDARMMLIALYRQTRRFEAAYRQIEQIERYEVAEKWEIEIQSEKERLKLLEKEDLEKNGEEPGSEESADVVEEKTHDAA